MSTSLFYVFNVRRIVPACWLPLKHPQRPAVSSPAGRNPGVSLIIDRAKSRGGGVTSDCLEPPLNSDVPPQTALTVPAGG